jgi:hypothetical protein
MEIGDSRFFIERKVEANVNAGHLKKYPKLLYLNGDVSKQLTMEGEG